jgi:hypothetical protein
MSTPTSAAEHAAALAVEGRAAQMHMAAALAEGRPGVIRWDKMRESVKDTWRQEARRSMEETP